MAQTGCIEDINTMVIGNFRCKTCEDTPGLFDGRRTCFRCNGKGEHDLADRRRNQAYDILNPEVAARVRERLAIYIRTIRVAPQPPY